ncbi:MAG: hypothetical protein SFU25_09050 [Candidatus Caenarcaniphilales bacterium]|nr:hypothetical protein [Candidatus Caenarcaniphilales bacterium]
MTLGNFPNNQIPANPLYAQNQVGQSYSPAFPTSSVNIPTLLPPTSSASFGTNFAKRAAGETKEKTRFLANSLSKVKGYFKRLGQALIGVKGKPEISEKNFAVPSKIDPADLPSSNEYDPMIGQWPANFTSTSRGVSGNLPKSSARDTAPLGSEIEQETNSEMNLDSAFPSNSGDSKASAEKLASLQKQLLAKQDPFGDLMGEMNQSQMDNQNLFNSIQ